MLMRKLRVLVVDDHALVRASLRASVDRDPELEVVGEAEDGAAATAQAAFLRPDIVVMDVSMPVLIGAEATRRVLEHQVPIAAGAALTTSETSRRNPIDTIRPKERRRVRNRPQIPDGLMTSGARQIRSRSLCSSAKLDVALTIDATAPLAGSLALFSSASTATALLTDQP